MAIPRAQRRYSGYKEDDGLLLVRVTCINCGLDSHRVETCVARALDDYREYLAFTPCERCGCTDTTVISYIYEGRHPANAVVNAVPFGSE